MSLITVIDINTGEEKRVDAEVSDRFPRTIYRNKRTRELDSKHAELLSKGFSPIPMGSCFTEGGEILPLFIGPAAKLGFYFGVKETDIPQSKMSYLDACKREHTIEQVDYEFSRLVFPVKFI